VYEAYWGLKEKPFANTPDPRYLYQAGDAGELFTRLLYTLDSNRGAAMLTGESGCGKTLMARALVQQLNPESMEVALLTNPTWDPEGFAREVLYQLGHESPPQTRPEIMHRLHEVLYENFEAGKKTLVLIDEGQLIADPAVFEEIRLMLNFQLNDAFLLTMLLVGQPDLAPRVKSSAPLDQRVAARGALTALAPEESGAYIAHRLGVAGRDEPVFSPEAVRLIHDHAEGIPRRINNLCDIALVIGFSRKLAAIDADWMKRFIEAEAGGL